MQDKIFILPAVERVSDGDADDVRRASPISRGDYKELQLGRLRHYWESKRGWMQSVLTGRPVDEKGKPVPWICYPCRYFLEGRIKPDFEVFEYGSGYSTLWWASRVKSIIACEHDQNFYDEIKPQLPANATYLLHKDQAGYTEAVLQQNKKFNVVVVDGNIEWRLPCARSAVRALTDDGIILWDNTNYRTPEYRAVFDELKELGFRQLEFVGHGPIFVREWPTSIFYRPGNCLDI